LTYMILTTHPHAALPLLADAHAPEDDRALRAGVEPGDFADLLSRDAADRLHFLRREVLHLLDQRLEAGDMGPDVLLVVELLLDEDRKRTRLNSSHVKISF